MMSLTSRAQHSAAEFADLLLYFRQGRQAQAVEFVGVEWERRAVPDAARVRRHAAGYVEQAGLFRRP
jgi:hypothetical protein